MVGILVLIVLGICMFLKSCFGYAKYDVGRRVELIWLVSGSYV